MHGLDTHGLDTGSDSYFASRFAEESSSNILLFNIFCSHWNYYYYCWLRLGYINSCEVVLVSVVKAYCSQLQHPDIGVFPNTM